MQRGEKRRTLIAAGLLTFAVCAGLFLQGGGRSTSERPAREAAFIPSVIPTVATAAAAEISPWERAAQKVAEDRGEPVGKQAEIDVPSQLRHYSDRRRFLAVQVAEWRAHDLETPLDYADLAGLIRGGELVEVKPVSDSYILYGVGGLATGDPFTSFDRSAGKSIALFDRAGLESEYGRIAESAGGLKNEIAALRREVAALPKRERARRAELRAKIDGAEKALKEENRKKALLDAHYGRPEEQARLFDRFAKVAALAGDFSGRAYDLADAESRERMKVRMLRHLRPEALRVLEEVAASYREEFDRPLPVSSLVRPVEYQHELSRVNANATRIAAPPHSTGLAFDIFNGYMTAGEQQHVMDDLARLEDEGRIEVLRENRDHFHVFAFVDGTRPGEELIRKSLDGAAAGN